MGYEEKFTEALKEVSSNSMKIKLVAIKNIIQKRMALEKEFKALNFKLESKYEEMYKPIYEKRQQVIEGNSEVTVDEIKESLAKVNLDETAVESTEKGIPHFWLKALKNSELGEMMNKKDEGVLPFLRNVTCDFKENGNFTLFFHFDKNDYFDHEVLTREFILDEKKLTISKIVSSKIEWKSEDVNPTIEKKKKKWTSSKTNMTSDCQLRKKSFPTPSNTI